VTDGERAIEFIDEIETGRVSCPGLIVLDLNLPKKTGKQVLDSIRARSACADAPVVVLTSSDNQKDRDDVSRLGASRYIRKPFRLADFLALGGVFKEMLRTQ
jgi:two-component system, response regulator